jgi:2-methylcitrate dehydratase PrpD
MSSQSGYTNALINFAVKTQFSEIPAEVIHETKRLILDTIGCAIGGTHTELGRIAIETADAMGGGSKEATVWGGGNKSSCVGAAFANGELANAMDADETLINFTHVCASILPAALAVAERAGASGKDVIAALAVGYDVASRVGVAMPRAEAIQGQPPNLTLASVKNTDFAWHVFGSVSATGRILGLDREKMANAFGVAGVNAPINATVAIKGYTAFFPMTKYTVMGYNGIIGMIAALLADRGFTGSHTILDGEYGFFRLVGIDPTFPEEMTKDLGKHWWVMEASYKPYPMNRIPQPGLDLFYEIITKNDLKPDDIREVVYKLHPRAVGHFDHWAIDQIETSMQFSFCFPMGFAMAAYGLEPGPEWHAPEHINDPKIKAFAKRVRMVADPDVLAEVYEEVGNAPRPVKKIVTTIEVIANDGRRFSGRKLYPKGDPWFADTRMTDDDLTRKFHAFTKRVLSEKQRAAIIETVYALDKARDIRSLTALLTR